MTRPTNTRTLCASFALLTLLGVGFAAPAQAQFGLFGSSEASPQDVVDTIAEHGFRLVGPLYRSGHAYVADVIDRRGRRERLVVSVETGQIVQRFFVDVGAAERRQAMVERPRPGDDDSFFSRLSRGWDDEPAPRPPLVVPDASQPDAESTTVLVPRPRAPREPRVVTRTELPPAKAAPPPVPGPETPADTVEKRQDAPAASANPAAPAGSPRATSVSTDPLRIPGTRKAAEPKSPAATVATAKPPEPPPAPAAPPPAPAKASKPADVPVAPLD